MFEKVKAIIVDQLSISDEDIITVDTTLEDLGADSLDLVELVMTLEDEFNIQIEDDAMDSLKTVGDVLDYIASK
jgi:acyl carrier protein